MTKKFDEKLKMYLALVKLFEGSAFSPDALPPALTEYINEFKGLVEAINPKAIRQKEMSDPDTGKKDLRERLSIDAGRLSEMLAVWSRTVQDTALTGKTGLGKWKLMRLKDNDLVVYCRQLVELGKAHADGLQKHGITLGFVENIGMMTDEFHAQVPKSRAVISEKSGISQNIGNIYTRADVLLKSRIDPMVRSFTATDNATRKIYQVNRKLVRQPTLRAKIRGRVTSELAPNGITNALVTVAGTDQEMRSTKTGIFAFRQLEAGTYTLTVTADNYQPCQLTNIVVGPGQPARVPVRMLAV